MKLISVNVSLPREVPHKGKAVSTGIFKQPVEGRVMLRALNLDGDGQADLIGHGGPNRAVYAYSIENYAHWERELGRGDFAMGQFGENFTVEGMLDDAVHVGDVFRVGGALVQISQPRVPCYKLGIKMGVEGFERTFLASGRIGFYFRVVEEGEVGAGDAIERVTADPERMTVRQISNLLYFDTENFDDTRRALRIEALSPGWKGSFEERLAKGAAPARPREGLRTLVVDRKAPESETITSFYLVPEDGEALPAHAPGQFLTLKLDIPGQPGPVTRTYTISESPNKGYYRLSIKREPAPKDRPDLPPGLSSNYFHDRVEPGARLRVLPPRGKFVLDPWGARPVVLASGGVGLTPTISMLNAIVEAGSKRPVWFVHGARNGREHAMGAHVRRMAAENANVRAHIRYSQPGANDVAGRDYDSPGRVDADLLRGLLPGNDFDFYLCGPTPFMKSLYTGLLAWDVPEARIHYEFFGPAAVLKPPPEADAGAAAERLAECSSDIEVRFARSGLTANWNACLGSILELAEAHGLSPAFSCRSGICHTCMCALEGGEVDYVEEPLEPPDPGSVLICCSKPTTNVVVDV